MKRASAQLFRAVLCGWSVWLLAGAPAADLDAIGREPNLEKRSKLALDNALDALKSARAAYNKGDDAAVATFASEVRASVDLADKSLKDTGKNPRRSPKYFKQAEIATRDLLRRLDAFQQEMSYADRSMLDGLRTRIQQVHDDLLMGLMEGKRK